MSEATICPHCRRKITEEDVENLRIWEEFKSECRDKRLAIRRLAKFSAPFLVIYLVFAAILADNFRDASGTILLSCFVVLVVVGFVFHRTAKQDRELFERYKKDFSYPPKDLP